MRNEREAPESRESIKVLQECIDLQIKKSQDYQNPASTILQSDHYRRGIDTIHDMLSQKMLRAESLLSTGGEGNFESLEDTYKDIINYASFAVSYLRGRMEGQYPDRDMFNRPKAVLADKLEEADRLTAMRRSGIVPGGERIKHPITEMRAMTNPSGSLKHASDLMTVNCTPGLTDTPGAFPRISGGRAGL